MSDNASGSEVDNKEFLLAVRSFERCLYEILDEAGIIHVTDTHQYGDAMKLLYGKEIVAFMVDGENGYANTHEHAAKVPSVYRNKHYWEMVGYAVLCDSLSGDISDEDDALVSSLLEVIQLRSAFLRKILRIKQIYNVENFMIRLQTYIESDITNTYIEKIVIGELTTPFPKWCAETREIVNTVISRRRL